VVSFLHFSGSCKCTLSCLAAPVCLICSIVLVLALGPPLVRDWIMFPFLSLLIGAAGLARGGEGQAI
jgi:hypothetical protein